MRQLTEMIDGKNAVLTRLRAELRAAESMHRAATPFSPAERWYGQQVSILRVQIGDVERELSHLVEVMA